MQDTTLLQLIESDLEPAGQLLELLRAEAVALCGRDMALLENILARKQSLIVQLQQHGLQRSQALSLLGMSPDREGLESLAKISGIGDELLAKSELLNELLNQCKAVNEENGRAIAQQQHATANQLRILNGGEPPSLYTATGTKSKLGTYRAFSQA
ncbi:MULTISPECIES: flagella synthesis protein FlgN [unclassified Pseudomonas]|uniref:flagella synthesis protein FlgN n=1 Tax=unclassified Pseudomonas TaxID=196821 RepID=UPI000BC52D3F|nr:MULTISPECIES: flagellar protein FlgN [unclassified Pseudomonas]PVZ13755.1 flagella synthesis protein FlgN [Pseudomonas sp. URIL14HWK12:I12]PVZ24061.1 flagella synthesis protein FlgN [Pseudomonas sp. URIL14HWK12:I10]PVZ33300.1 flagella synthesis protein FlgN [Pseudomonas sp. URIL14HWK12:I11]SNZ11066.1 flagella synthesis protein FlgN [Pseudomonas sp. URIL14HWK12:I9]